jgi:hypothetical protein
VNATTVVSLTWDEALGMISDGLRRKGKIGPVANMGSAECCNLNYEQVTSPERLRLTFTAEE